MSQPEMIVALDVPNAAEMRSTLERMPDSIGWYKVGLELFCSEGPSVLAPLQKQNKSIFLDLKLHDIPRTVGNAVKTAAEHGVNLMTVHAVGGRAMMEEAAEAAASCECPPKLVAVTTLTSLNQDDFSDLGVNRTVEEQAIALGELAICSGIDGLVTSAHEAHALRNSFPEALLVTPGIRMPSGDIGDQKRVATPFYAVENGATHLVIGRPIVQAADPVLAVSMMLDDMKKAVK
ncbi:MAG TPA: orotidine-5'-phosphate decarboxylase [Verrucomicrobia bacterium]|mgnify:FL=1|nr:orotidine-5'-phosphate decarboxylase [Kiritimatiellaceae bacterium]HBO88037.1 orotidine-5'-phosphate decarboxylase [Verrucomicrobiota bacterium]